MLPSLVLVKGVTKLEGEYDDQVKEFFSRRFPNAHLKVFDLSSTSISSQSFGREGLRQQAEVLLQELLRERAENDVRFNTELYLDRSDRTQQDQNGDIPVAFIGHDIGGSLIKQARDPSCLFRILFSSGLRGDSQVLVLATEELSYQWIARNTAAVVCAIYAQ
jgi:hypothetical protein